MQKINESDPESFSKPTHIEVVYEDGSRKVIKFGDQYKSRRGTHVAKAEERFEPYVGEVHSVSCTVTKKGK